MSSESTTSPVEKLTKAAEMLQKVAKPLVKIVSVALPFIIDYISKAWAVWKKLPKNVMNFIIGAIFCFFGGLYPVTFAAIQAAEHGGRKKVVAALEDLSEEALKIIEASKKDDTEDKDGDGKADVEQIDGKALLMRKFNLVITKMDPQKVDKAISSMYQVWLAVVAVLTLKFARTIALALSISEFLMKPIERYLLPTVAKATPQDYRKWVPVVARWIVKAIAMSIAWYIQTIISAVTSALTGGLMMAHALYEFCQQRGITMGGLFPKNHEDTLVDEICSYIFAALGFFFQFKIGFDMPFPFNLILFPLEFAEYYIRWTITKVQ